MRKRQPLRIRHTIVLAVGLTVASTALAACSLYGYQTFRIARQGQRVRAAAIAETYASMVGPQFVAGGREQVARVVRELTIHADVCLLAVLDRDGSPIANRGSEPLLKRYRESSASILGAPLVIDLAAESKSPEPPLEVDVCTAPICLPGGQDMLGTVVCAVRPTVRATMTTDAVSWFFAKLATIAAAGMFIALLWLRHSVLVPLGLLTEKGKTSGSGELPTERGDEIGDLARVLAEMHIGMEEWRQRAIRLERSVNDRVAEETRQVSRELQQTKRKIWLDPLTRLGNRRLFDEKFADIFRAQRQADQDLSIVMIDVDNFKTVNDVLGHKAGDEMLRFTGELLKQCLREQDLAIRMGGDEFLLVLPGVSASNALSIAERTLLMFAQQSKLLEIEPKPSMSAGIASLLEHHPADPEGLLQMADEALYTVKRQGKSSALIRPRSASRIPAHAS